MTEHSAPVRSARGGLRLAEWWLWHPVLPHRRGVAGGALAGLDGAGDTRTTGLILRRQLKKRWAARLRGPAQELDGVPNDRPGRDLERLDRT